MKSRKKIVTIVIKISKNNIDDYHITQTKLEWI